MQQLFKEALKIRESLNGNEYLSPLAQTHQDFANYYSSIQNTNESNKHFKFAIQLFQKASVFDSIALFWKAQALIDYGAFLFNTFKYKRASEAMEIFNQAKRILENYDVEKEPFLSAYSVLLQNIYVVNNT